MKKAILVFVLLASFILVSAQKKSVVVGTLIDRPNAILVISPPNSDQGFLLPQLTSAQRLSISPASPEDDGLLVFDITDQSFYYWSSTQWVKGLGTIVTPTKQFYAVDPTSFLGLEPDGKVGADPILGLFESDNTYVAATGESREIMASINLPHGSSIQNVTAYYVDNEAAGNVTIQLLRKKYTGGNEVLSTFTSGGASAVIQTQDLPAIPAASSLVDNSSYTYRLHVIFGNGVDNLAALTALQRIHGVRIEFIK